MRDHLASSSTLDSALMSGGLLIGVSAGAILLTPSVESAALCGDATYPELSDRSALNLVDFAIMVHFDESPMQCAELERFAARSKRTVYGVPDGSGVVVDGSRLELLGRVVTSNASDS
jgi:dipeptidase E